MPKFKTKKARTKPEINTSALPDIIFMLLFFFMVVTVLRKSSLLVNVEIPNATEIEKIRHKSLVQYIYIGKPVDPKRGNVPVIQINDAFVSLDQVERAARIFRDSMPADKQAWVTSSLKVDKGVEMGIVTDVKISLRKAQQFRVNYAALPKEME